MGLFGVDYLGWRVKRVRVKRVSLGIKVKSPKAILRSMKKM